MQHRELSLDEAIDAINAAIEQGNGIAPQHDLAIWERRFNGMFPDGLTQEQVDEANTVMWSTQEGGVE
jgi:hypothetical protein